VNQIYKEQMESAGLESDNDRASLVQGVQTKEPTEKNAFRVGNKWNKL